MLLSLSMKDKKTIYVCLFICLDIVYLVFDYMDIMIDVCVCVFNILLEIYNLYTCIYIIIYICSNVFFE